MLESADNLLRNKRLQPMSCVDTITAHGQRRKVYVDLPTDTVVSKAKIADKAENNGMFCESSLPF